ncbi:hypothetical protein [Sphingobacterium mizutaii]|nr:hypothetical protein [Sphingobacterium mizutaii]
MEQYTDFNQNGVGRSSLMTVNVFVFGFSPDFIAWPFKSNHGQSS